MQCNGQIIDYSCMYFLIAWIFFRSEFSESNLTKWIGISSLSIQIVSQNTVNSRIAAHNKNKQKFHKNCDYISNASTKN